MDALECALVPAIEPFAQPYPVPLHLHNVEGSSTGIGVIDCQVVVPNESRLNLTSGQRIVWAYSHPAVTP